jgi:protein O-mannosyl-transferase
MNKKYIYLIVIFLIVASCFAFGRIAGNGFINFDDNIYITENNHIKSGINPENIKWAFTAVVSGNWHPLTLISHMLDWSLFGANASGHHLISLLLHIGSVLLLFLFLNKTTNNLWPSAFAAALFALHPLRAESVAWAAERKDVLSMFFGMASIYAYAFYAESSKTSRYLLCLILFALALMSKPMLVTLPFVLMLLDYWPLKRWQEIMGKPAGKLILEKVPFLLLAITSSIITLWAQNKEGSVASVNILPFLTRGTNAIISYTAYLEKIFWPVNLSVFYPYDLSLSLWKVLISGFILTGITAVVLYYIKKLPFLFVGWFWYLGGLVPVIGLVQVGRQAMADRYTYLSFVGIAVGLAWGIPSIIKSDNIRKKILFTAAITALATLALLTWQQCGYWKNSHDLFSHALRVTKNNHVAHGYLAAALFKEGNPSGAIYHFNKAININSNYADDYNNRGGVYANLGQHEAAIKDYNEAIRLKPDFAGAYFNRGTSYGITGQDQLAIEDLNEAIRLKPDFAGAYNNRAIVYLKQGDNIAGCNDARRACALGNCKTLESPASRKLCR